MCWTKSNYKPLKKIKNAKNIISCENDIKSKEILKK